MENIHKGEMGRQTEFSERRLFRTYTDHEKSCHNGLVSTNFGAPIKLLFSTEERWNQTKYTPPFLTEDYDKCHFYRKVEYVDDVTSYAYNSVQITDVSSNERKMTIRTDRVGCYKNKRWAFQEESRFVLFFLPGNPTASFNTPDFMKEQAQFMEDIMQNKGLGFSHYDMHLSDKAFEHLTITMSPLCDDAQLAIVEALRDKYAPRAEIRRSNLAGKLAK